MPVTTTPEENVALAERFNREVFNGRDYDAMDDLIAADAVQHGPMTGQTLSGRDAMREYMTQIHAGFSDLKATREMSLTDGDYVVSRYTYEGTHDGEFMGVPATGKRGKIHGITINRVEGGKMTESWVSTDFLGLLQQVGVVPSPDEMAA